MARNRVQFQKGLSETRFDELYGSADRWREAVFRWRWPRGFVCPGCGRQKHPQPLPVHVLPTADLADRRQPDRPDISGDADLRAASAPDYWKLSPFYVPQQTSSACSVASTAMTLNFIRGLPSVADQRLVTPGASEKGRRPEVDQRGRRTRQRRHLCPENHCSSAAFGRLDPDAEVGVRRSRRRRAEPPGREDRRQDPARRCASPRTARPGSPAAAERGRWRRR